MSYILYKHYGDGSFIFREEETLEDYDDSMMDGRLYYKGDRNDCWGELLLENTEDLYYASDEYIMAFTAYRLGDPEIFLKVKKYEKIMSNNSRAGKKTANNMTSEERSARAKKAVEARIQKYSKKD